VRRRILKAPQACRKSLAELVDANDRRSWLHDGSVGSRVARRVCFSTAVRAAFGLTTKPFSFLTGGATTPEGAASTAAQAALGGGNELGEVRFAIDSPVEGGGFEPSVPFAKKPRFRPLTRASKDGQSTCRGPCPPAQRKTFTSAPRISLVV
jgi:hypothetical protein